MAVVSVINAITALLLLVCVQLGDAQLTDLKCNFGWVSMRTHRFRADTSCFWFSREPETYISAASWCERIDGAHLAEIPSLMLNNDLLRASQRLQPGKKFWIGLTDVEVDGWFKWYPSKKAAYYMNFAPGHGVKPQLYKNCIFMDDKGLWYEDSCASKHLFICEK